MWSFTRQIVPVFNLSTLLHQTNDSPNQTLNNQTDPGRERDENLTRIKLDFQNLGRFYFTNLGRILTKNDMNSSRFLVIIIEKKSRIFILIAIKQHLRSNCRLLCTYLNEEFWNINLFA